MASKQETSKSLTAAMTHILLILVDGENHGYGIMTGIAEMTKGSFEIGPGTLYRTIKQLLVDGLIEESEERPAPDLDDERRRYYKITALGYKTIQIEVRRLENLVKRAQSKGLTNPIVSMEAYGG
jgi:DNA-binding PadR family transcriptional regulator